MYLASSLYKKTQRSTSHLSNCVYHKEKAKLKQGHTPSSLVSTSSTRKIKSREAMDVGAHESTSSKVSGTELATNKVSKNKERLKRKMAGGLEEVAEDQKSTSGVAVAADGRRVTPRYDQYLPWPIDGLVVDEQMSWGSLWIPCWDVDFLGEDYHRALYDDVVLYDDIWNLRSINKIPSSLEGRRGQSS